MFPNTVNVSHGFLQSPASLSRRQVASSSGLLNQKFSSSPLSSTSLSATRKIDVGMGEGLSTFGKVKVVAIIIKFSRENRTSRTSTCSYIF